MVVFVNDTLNADLSAFITLENANMIGYIMRKWRLSMEAAEDILQDAYESCLLYRASYKDYGSINQYVFGVVRKMVAGFFKTNNPHSYKKEPVYEELTGNEASQPTVETVILFKETENFVARLPLRQRIVAQHYMSSYKETEIADILQTTNTNVKAMWSIVMGKIRRSLG